MYPTEEVNDPNIAVSGKEEPKKKKKKKVRWIEEAQDVLVYLLFFSVPHTGPLLRSLLFLLGLWQKTKDAE